MIVIQVGTAASNTIQQGAGSYSYGPRSNEAPAPSTRPLSSLRL